MTIPESRQMTDERESCPTCSAPVIRKKGMDNGLPGAAKIASADTFAYAPISVSADSTRDWTEDFSHENGQYQRTCKSCGELFIGHKRRLVCRKCVSVSADRPAEVPTDAERKVLDDAIEAYNNACVICGKKRCMKGHRP